MMSVKNKNIHVLPTDKEPVKGDLLLRHIWKDTSNECISWWRYDDTITIDGVVQYTTLNGSFRDITSSFKVQHIYITSDEEIKEGDWYWLEKIDRIGSESGAYKSSGAKVSKLNTLASNCKKIILTTDQDLIKDGVQAIDDEFLEWFVKNPSCEEVETYSLGIKNQLTGESGHYKYEIIIPSEEAKEETLEEVALKYASEKLRRVIIPYKEFNANVAEYVGFVNGAKWQAKRMYSEEEVLKIITKTWTECVDNYGNNFKKLKYKIFEQFKNK